MTNETLLTVYEQHLSNVIEYGKGKKAAGELTPEVEKYLEKRTRDINHKISHLNNVIKGITVKKNKNSDKR